MELTIKQTLALDALEDNNTNELIFGGGAGGGKSVLGCYWILKGCLRYPGSRWVIGRNTLKTLKETTLNTFWEVCLQQGVVVNKHFTFNESKSLLSFKNGSEILLKDLAYYPSDPEFTTLGSLEITGAFVDECSEITSKAWNILKSRIRYKIDDNKIIPKILGTCNPSKNWVYTSFYIPYSQSILPEEKKFIQSLLEDNSHVSSHYGQMLMTLDYNSIQRLRYGNWDYDSDARAMVDIEAILDCFTNETKPNLLKKRLSADLAMQGRDRFTVAFWQGNVVEFVVDKLKSSGKEIERDLQILMETYSVGKSQTIADSDGMGSYLESYLPGIKEFHGGGKAFDIEYINIKSECAFKLAEKINKRELKIICTPSQKEQIISELGVLKVRSIDRDETRKAIIKKEDMKKELKDGKSPDYLDTLIMGMYWDVIPKVQFSTIPGFT